MAVVTMQAKGQMTLPRQLRDALGIDTGTQLVCIQTGPGVFECHVLPKPMGLREFIDAHPIDCPDLTQEDIDAAIEEGLRAEADAKYGDLIDAANAAASRRTGTGS